MEPKTVQPIPLPEILEPDRPLRTRGTQFKEDDRPTEELLNEALHESCEYGQQLWKTLDEVRQYLLTSLPPDPRSPGITERVGASPTGPDDEEGWQQWGSTFAAVTSALCGPQGDNGFGLARATEEVEIRRSAPVVKARVARAEATERVQNPPAAAKGNRRRDLVLIAVGAVVGAVWGIRR